jgi:hypothetical protein
MQCLIGLTIQPLFTALNTLLVDLHPDQPSTAQAACNLVRCELAAAVLAALDAILRAAGAGWSFTVFGLAMLGILPLLWCLEHYGMEWRQRNMAGDRVQSSMCENLPGATTEGGQREGSDAATQQGSTSM